MPRTEKEIRRNPPVQLNLRNGQQADKSMGNQHDGENGDFRDAPTAFLFHDGLSTIDRGTSQ